MTADKLIVGLSGMPGSGKSIVVSVAKNKGFGIIVMGDIIREETQKRGLLLTPKNMGKVMLDLRMKWGNNIIAKKCIPKINKKQFEKILIDGLRSLDELNLFKKHFSKFNLIVIHSSPETRYNRLYQRGRSDDPKDRKIFQERDIRELNVGLGQVIALSDYLLINEFSIKEIKSKSQKIFQRIEKKWMQ
jgi:dephospho-CoA kinase